MNLGITLKGTIRDGFFRIIPSFSAENRQDETPVLIARSGAHALGAARGAGATRGPRLALDGASALSRLAVPILHAFSTSGPKPVGTWVVSKKRATGQWGISPRVGQHLNRESLERFV